MSNMNVEIEAIVKHIGKNITFLQPLYEAIVNSLEANADKIEVSFFRDNQLSMWGENNKINSFSITDNGDGFIDDNINSFDQLWSSHKKEFGCKGSGRFTWLNVFQNIDILSEIPAESKVVEISFSKQYDPKTKKVTPNYSLTEQKTTITFRNVTNKFYNPTQNKNTSIDMRENADLENIYYKIFNYLLIKLFLLKRKNKVFSITLKLDEKKKIITNNDIPQLNLRQFSIPTNMQNCKYGNKIDFDLYYIFKQDQARSKKAYYCAHERTVKKIDDDGLGFSASLPNNDSFIVLLCSNYFDDNVNDDRDKFEGLEGDDLKSRNFLYPLLIGDIKQELKKQINDIIIQEYPDILKTTETIKASAIAKAPYLASYINENTDTLVSEDSLIKEAQQEFNKAKVKAKTKFHKLLENAEINLEALQLTVNEVSEIAAAELGEYILYRDAIIQALNVAVKDKNKAEDFIHNIFMPKKTKCISPTNETNYTMTNLWLLDDKFMTFSSAYSDKAIKQIIEEVFFNESIQGQQLGMDNKRPDMVVFYNKEVSHDAIVVEFKGAHAPLGEKEKASSEIKRNCFLLREKAKEINSIWAYIITHIDHEYEVNLLANDYQPLFTNAKDGKIFYYYGKNANAHIYVLDINAITDDAFARNKTFLDILKKV